MWEVETGVHGAEAVVRVWLGRPRPISARQHRSSPRAAVPLAKPHLRLSQRRSHWPNPTSASGPCPAALTSALATQQHTPPQLSALQHIGPAPGPELCASWHAHAWARGQLLLQAPASGFGSRERSHARPWSPPHPVPTGLLAAVPPWAEPHPGYSAAACCGACKRRQARPRGTVRLRRRRRRCCR
jgi:hypothetical protein